MTDPREPADDRDDDHADDPEYRDTGDANDIRDPLDDDHGTEPDR